jgi:O-antigen/teichoic acid export membrane protein
MSLPLGNSILRGVFGEGYGSASAALTLLVLASTAQTIVLTGLKTLQAEARLGHIPTVLVASFLAHSTLTLLLSKEWPLGGPAGALLGATLLIEMPVILRQLLQRLPESKIFVPGLLRVFIRETLLFYAGTILVIILLSRGNLSPALNWILSIAGASLIGFAVLELAKYFRFTDRQNASTVGVASDPNFKSINYKEEQIEDTWLD